MIGICVLLNQSTPIATKTFVCSISGTFSTDLFLGLVLRQPHQQLTINLPGNINTWTSISKQTNNMSSTLKLNLLSESPLTSGVPETLTHGSVKLTTLS